ncbi:NAD(P)/FAD-dependent oxidoreductase [Marinobacter sp. M1N3S26]|uniref:NAD(P)/FAD-dependent oxidoreductase n=1 Tax=Marinobacter sp. M1N3S26 TaxID=3382299 RepID=UPI00387AE25F
MSSDVIVIGGSFAGFSAAMQLARGQRNVIVIDAGKPRNRFSEASHGFFCLDGFSPSEIRRRAARQLAKYPTARVIEGLVNSAKREGDGFSVIVDSGETYTAAKLILATGLRDELPDLPGLAERWGKTVIHCPYCHGYELRNRQLGVMATGPLSTHQAAIIPDWGPTTYFTQDQQSPDPEQTHLLTSRGVVIETSAVVEIMGETPSITGVRLADGRTIPLEGLYVGPKARMASPLAQQLGCEFEEGPMGPVVKVDDLKRTSVAGVFAAGDMSNKWQNATLASASGVMAGTAAHRALMFGE